MHAPWGPVPAAQQLLLLLLLPGDLPGPRGPPLHPLVGPPGPVSQLLHQKAQGRRALHLGTKLSKWNVANLFLQPTKAYSFYIVLLLHLYSTVLTV